MVDTAPFGDGIGPANLLAQVRATAPWLWSPRFVPPSTAPGALADLVAGPDGWLAVLHAGERLPATPSPSAAQRVDYLALCCAAHHGTVATFCPTDVDIAIRGHAWRDADAERLARQAAIARAMRGWDLRRISARWVDRPTGPVSGHEGEWFGVMLGMAGGLLALGDTAGALAVADEAETEAARAGREFLAVRDEVRRGGDALPLLALAAILTHNAGDIDQGLAHWSDAARASPEGTAIQRRLARLAHEGPQRLAGAYALAAQVYKALLAAEGHRHYPLRAVKALRAHEDLLLPLGPCFDAWGARIATHPALKPDDRAEVAAALVAGCRKIPGQTGYFRALAGIASATPLDRLAERMPAQARKALQDPALRRQLAVRRESFEHSLRKQALGILG